MIEKRLFIIANRLPVYFNKAGKVIPASGGLASAIHGYLQQSHLENDTKFLETFWAGVPGCSPETWSRASYQMNAQPFQLLPVFVNGKLYDPYYNAISNSVIWPLFHYFPSYAEYDWNAYESYKQVNAMFVETLLKHVRDTDVIWIHDYHLLPLAAMLRKALPRVTIGFFLHIPFPSYEMMRLLPRKWQEDLISGMLGADLIGFHTKDYATHFLESVRMVMGVDHDAHVLKYDNRLIKVGVFPISIDFNKFHEAYENEEVIRHRDSYRESFQDKKIIFSIDRLDYTKGVLNRIRGYEHFLKQNPSFHNKVVFIMVIIPSRNEIVKYAERKKMIDEAIGNINSKIGNIEWQPLIYQYNSLSFERMIAMFTVSDLALITPLRDGMNLVSKEFVASRKDKKGVLVLSELAGSAKELVGGLLINPNDVHEISDAIKKGLEMDVNEQQKRMQIMQSRLEEYNVKAWANDFIKQLQEVKRFQKKFEVSFLDKYSKVELFHRYQQANRRLILLDYDGTLVPFEKDPGDAKPGKNLLHTLRNLCLQKQNDVFIISGRNSDWLESQMGDLPLSLIAEHGAKIKPKGSAWKTEILRSDEWKKDIYALMDDYVKRCAHSFIEEKQFSMVWHYRNAQPEEGKLNALELFTELNEITHHLDLQAMMGNKIVEVRTRGIGKDLALKSLLEKNSYDFILAIGDDRTDEDMFRIIADLAEGFSIKIGPDASYAKYNLLTQQMAVSLLETMAELKHEVMTDKKMTTS